MRIKCTDDAKKFLVAETGPCQLGPCKSVPGQAGRAGFLFPIAFHEPAGLNGDHGSVDEHRVPSHEP